MKVNISYYDNTSFTLEEIVKLAQTNYGKSVHVEVHPDSFAPHDQIYFALQQIITFRQLDLLFSNKDTYQEDIKVLRAEVIAKVTEIVDSVIMDNEDKIE